MVEWNEYLRQLVLLFRKEYEKLPIDRRSQVSNLNDFSAPCQIEAIWATNAQLNLNFQLLLISHFGDRDDFDFNLHGPIELHKMASEMEFLRSEKKWKRKLLRKDAQRFPKSVKSYQDIFEDGLIHFAGHIRGYISSVIFQEPRQLPAIDGRWLLTSEVSCWFVFGDVRSANPGTVIDSIFKEAKRRPRVTAKTVPKKEDKTPAVRKTPIVGYGTFLYPPVRFDELPDVTFGARIMGLPALAMPRLVVNTMYKNRKVLVYRDGLLFIGENNIHKATAMLNELTSVISFLLTPSFSLKESELGETVIDSNDFKMVRGSMPLISERTRLFEDRWSQFDKHKWTQRKQLSSHELLRVLERAKQIAQEKSIVDNLLLWHEGFTYFENSEYTQCFIMNWIIIEKHIFGLLSEFLQHQLVEKDRAKKLLKSHSWTTDHFLEVLSLSGRLEKGDYKEYMRLKRVRNEIVHKGKRVSQEDAETCLKKCTTIIEKEI